MTYRLTDEAWLDILARAIVKAGDESDAKQAQLPNKETEPDDWTDDEFEAMESWAHEVFKPLRD